LNIESCVYKYALVWFESSSIPIQGDKKVAFCRDIVRKFERKYEHGVGILSIGVQFNFLDWIDGVRSD